MLEHATQKDMQSLRERREVEKVREQQALISTAPPNGPIPELKGNITFTDYDDVNQLIGDTSGERRVRSISPYAWVQAGPDKYILTNRDGSFIRIERQTDAETFLVMYIAKLAPTNGTPFARPRQIGKAITFENAIHAADTFATKAFQYEVVHKAARWRMGPASEGQIDFLNKFRKEGDKLTYGSVTKGRAADRITKIKHGAKGSFNKLALQKRIAARAVDKKNAWKQKQAESRVRVGRVA
jgi:ATP-dependent helicase IRC3